MENVPRDRMDDAELMLRVRGQDDEAAFALLVSRHQKSLLNFFARSGVQYDSEDLVQQTFLRLYRYRQRYVATAKFTTFLFLLARQVWIDELRRRQRRERLIERLVVEPHEEFTAPADPSAGEQGRGLAQGEGVQARDQRAEGGGLGVRQFAQMGVQVHGVSPLSSPSSARSLASALNIRDFTVPTGIPRIAATSA